jgi:hypothetical protein
MPETILHHLQVFPIHAGSVADSLIDDLEQPGDDRQEAPLMSWMMLA